MGFRVRKRQTEYIEPEPDSDECTAEEFSDSIENENEIRCKFIPFSVLKTVKEVSHGEKSQLQNNLSALCDKSILKLRKIGSMHDVTHSHSWKVIYTDALKQAAYSHNWDELFCLLMACPIWEHYDTSRNSNLFVDNYYRALAILLMYHPTAQAENLMREILVMVLSFRSEEEQRAFVKTLVCLPDKIISRVKNITQHEIVMQFK